MNPVNPVNLVNLANLVIVNYPFDRHVLDPDALLTRYATLTGWSEAVAGAGVSRVTVVQRFRSAAHIARRGVAYVFCTDVVEMHRAVAILRPDVAHLNGLDFPVQTWLLKRALPAASALVIQDHASAVPLSKTASPAAVLRRALRRRGLGRADAFFFSAAEQAAGWRRAGLIAPGRPVYEVMEASTDMRGVDRGEARARTRTSGEPALLWVGRLMPNKDPLTVLDAFDAALSALPAATLTMIFSEGPLLPDVRARLARSSRLEARVRLLQDVPHDAMAAYYSAADLFVLGSHHEGSGYALLEACACGLVPVVTNIPSFRTITNFGACGALWTPGDHADCARAVVSVAGSDLAALRRRTSEHFLRTLSWPAIGRRAADHYRNVLAARRAA